MPLQDQTTLLPIQLAADAPGKVAENGPSDCGRLRWCSQLLAEAWSSPGLGGYVDSELAHTRSL